MNLQPFVSKMERSKISVMVGNIGLGGPTMTMKLDWSKLMVVKEKLKKKWDFEEDKNLIFVYTTQNGPKKEVVQFKDFLNFFWNLYDNSEDIKSISVLDANGTIVYRHKNINSSGEEIPIGNGNNLILLWNKLTPTQKNTHMKILLTEIYND